MRRLLIPALVSALVFPAAAGAATPRAGDHVMIESLSPSLQSHIMQRMGPKQRVPELIETTILNDLMQTHASVRNFERFGTGYRAEVMSTDGEWQVIDVDPMTYQIVG